MVIGQRAGLPLTVHAAPERFTHSPRLLVPACSSAAGCLEHVGPGCVQPPAMQTLVERESMPWLRC